MKISKRIAVLTFVAACAAGPAWAQQTDAPQRTSAPEQARNARFGDPTIFGMKYQDYFYGVVAKIQPTAIVLDKTKVGVPQTIELTKKTKFVRNGKKSTLAQLKTGEMVYVDAKTDKKTGTMTARKVVSGMEIMAAP
ncbi:MAG: hypothetical protein ACRD3D_09775 [Terriglobia bacterium]